MTTPGRARAAAQFHGLQGNEKFPDIKALCDQIHALGLKFGIYSTPWETSYAGFPGGSSENPEGTWTKPAGQDRKEQKHPAVGHRANIISPPTTRTNGRAWGVDYLKYDWNPIELPETQEMADALRHSGRDIVFSLSNNMNITNGPTIGKIANSWRTTGDIKANWKSMSERGFGQDKWRKYSSPGHWNDPDMLEIATKERNQPGLTPDEEYTHMTLWCLLDAPLLLANDLSDMDAFTQKPAGERRSASPSARIRSATRRWKSPATATARVYAKKMEDGSKAVGLFNTGTNGTITVTVKWSDLKIHGSQNVRDLWRQKDDGKFNGEFSLPVAPHSAELVKISP